MLKNVKVPAGVPGSRESRVSDVREREKNKEGDERWRAGGGRGGGAKQNTVGEVGMPPLRGCLHYTRE